MKINYLKSIGLLLLLSLCSCNGQLSSTSSQRTSTTSSQRTSTTSSQRTSTTSADPQKLFNITFDSQGAGDIDSQNIKAYGKVNEPLGLIKNPSDEKYFYLNYWYKNNEINTPYDFSTPVTGNFKLTAHWQEYSKNHPSLTSTTGVDFGKDVDPLNGAQFGMEKNLMKVPETIEAWVNINRNTTSPEGFIVSNEETDSIDYFLSTTNESFPGAGCWYENRRIDSAFAMYVDKLGHPAFFRYNGDSYSIKNNKGSFRYIIEDVDLRNSVWTHIAFTTNLNTGEVSFYLNGNKHSSIIVPNLNDLFVHDTVCVGGDFLPNNPGYFKGRLFDLRLWNDLRTSQEISNKKDVFVPSNEEGLESNYIFDEKLTNLKKVYDIRDVHNLRRLETWKSLDNFNEPDYDYSFAILGDTQTLAKTYKQKNIALAKHIADNKDKFNTKFVINVGDISNGIIWGQRDRNEWYDEFKNAKEASKEFDKAGIPFSIAPGNHDYEEDSNQPPSSKTGSKYRNTDLMNEYFPLSDKKAYSCYGGSFVEQNGLETQENTYFLLDIEGNKYLILNLELGPRDEVLAWANQVISSHSDYQVIAFSHAGLSLSVWDTDFRYTDLSQYWYINDPNEGDMIWDKCLRKHSNVIAFFDGHYCGERIGRRQDVGDNGNIVNSFMVDFTETEFNRGGVQVYALLGFTNGGKTCTLTARSVEKNAIYLGDENIITFDVGAQANLPTLTKAPEGKTTTHSGNPIELVTNGTCENGQIVYRTGVSGEFSSTYRATDSGTYNIQYKIKGNDGYQDTPILGTIVSKIKKDSGVPGWDITNSANATIKKITDGVEIEGMKSIGDRVTKDKKVHVDGLSFTCTIKGVANTDLRGWYLHNGSDSGNYYTETKSAVWTYCGLYGQIRCMLGKNHEYSNVSNFISYKETSTSSSIGLGGVAHMLINSIGDSNMTNTFTFEKVNNDWYKLTFTGVRDRGDYQNYNMSNGVGYTYIPASNIPMDENGDAYFATFGRSSVGASTVIQIINL